MAYYPVKPANNAWLHSPAAPDHRPRPRCKNLWFHVESTMYRWQRPTTGASQANRWASYIIRCKLMTFSDIVDAADDLSVDEQETLVGILRRRIAKRNRDALVRDVAEARGEFQTGQARASSVGNIMDEVRGES